MPWTTRSATVAVLVVALAALPLVMDQCVAACEAEHDAHASAPACHHTSLTTSPIGHTPAPCGHDHSGTVGTTAAPVASVLAFNSMVAVVVVVATILARPAGDSSGLTHSPPGFSLSLDTRLLPLRI